MEIGSFILTVSRLQLADGSLNPTTFIPQLSFSLFQYQGNDKAPHSLTQTKNMKINTKECTPIKGTPDWVMVHPNKFIESGATVFAPAAESTDEVCGRESKYLPYVIYTPVMTSKRLDSHSRLLSHDDIDELNQKLENLLMDKGINEDKSKPKEKDEESKDEHEQQYPVSKEYDATSEEVAVVGLSSVVGRFQKVVFSYKSNTASKVSRSVRLVCYGK
jgi:hypothetical protein